MMLFFEYLPLIALSSCLPYFIQGIPRVISLEFDEYRTKIKIELLDLKIFLYLSCHALIPLKDAL